MICTPPRHCVDFWLSVSPHIFGKFPAHTQPYFAGCSPQKFHWVLMHLLWSVHIHVRSRDCFAICSYFWLSLTFARTDPQSFCCSFPPSHLLLHFWYHSTSALSCVGFSLHRLARFFVEPAWTPFSIPPSSLSRWDLVEVLLLSLRLISPQNQDRLRLIQRRWWKFQLSIDIHIIRY